MKYTGAEETLINAIEYTKITSDKDWLKTIKQAEIDRLAFKTKYNVVAISKLTCIDMMQFWADYSNEFRNYSAN